MVVHSILIPAYNADGYIEKAIVSCLSQSFSDFELLVSDNASSDSTYEIASKFAARDSRVHVFRQEKNLGMVGNWNWLLSKAKGETFQILCADDYLLPTFLEEVFRVKNSSNVVFSNAMVLKNGQVSENKPLYVHGDVSHSRYLWNMHGAPLSALVFNKEEGVSFDGNFQFNCDFEYLYRVCFVRGLRLFFINRPLVGVLIHDSNETKRFDIKAENRSLLYYFIMRPGRLFHKAICLTKLFRLRFF